MILLIEAAKQGREKREAGRCILPVCVTGRGINSGRQEES